MVSLALPRWAPRHLSPVMSELIVEFTPTMSHARHSPRALIAAIASLFIFVTSCSSSVPVATSTEPKLPSPKEQERLKALYGVALSIMRPDYDVDHSIAVESSPGGSSGGNPLEIDMYQVPGYGYSIGQGGRGRETVAIRPGVGGDDVSQLSGTDATDTLRMYIQGTGRGASAMKKVNRVLDGLKFEYVAVSAIAELVHPMSDEEREVAGLDDAEKALFDSVGLQGLPIAWDSDSCIPLKLKECTDPGGFVSPFRAWVGSLSQRDREFLRFKGIDVAQLETAAANSKTKGLMWDSTNPEGVRELVRNPKIRAVYLIGIMLRKPIP